MNRFIPRTHASLLASLVLCVSLPVQADNDLEDMEALMQDPEFAATVHQIGTIPLSSNTIGYDPCDDPRASKDARTGCEANGKIEHVIYITLENHTFDNYFGRVNVGKLRVPGADGTHDDAGNLKPHAVVPQRLGQDSDGNARNYRFPTELFHLTEYCGWSDLGHKWSDIHGQANYGRMDGFLVKSSTNAPAMGQFEYKDLAFYYDIAERFAIADRVFTSAASQSWPNHYYLVSGTSGGFINNDLPVVSDNAQGRLSPIDMEAQRPRMPETGHSWQTIFESLEQAGVSWRVYSTNLAIPMAFNNFKKWVATGHFATIAQYHEDLAAGKLPQVVYLAPGVSYSDEHPGSGNHQRGQAHVSALVKSLMASTFWPKSVFYVTYDDAGGWYDHVPPPRGYQPNDQCDLSPRATPENCVNGTWAPGSKEGHGTALPEEERFGDNFDQLGARVPFSIISPWVKQVENGGYVSHHVYENATILSFIEWRFGLPSLNNRTRAYKDGWRNPGCDWDMARLQEAAVSRGATEEIRALLWSAQLPEPFRTVRCEACPADDPFCPGTATGPGRGKGGGLATAPGQQRGGSSDPLLSGRAQVRDPNTGELIPMQLAFRENRYLDPLLDPFDFTQEKQSLLDGVAVAAELSPESETDVEQLAECPAAQQRFSPDESDF